MMSAGRLITIILAFVVGALGVLGAMAWTPLGAPDEPAIRAAAARYSARIIRDAFGVPHIYGERDADVAFGLGFAHAEDDWATLEEAILGARGELAMHVGRAGAEIDYVVRLLRVREVVAERYQADLQTATRALVEGYADGLNAWAIDNRGDVRRGVLPVTGQDVVAGFVLRTPFMFGLDDELGALFGPERARGIALAPLEDAALDEAPPEGSNAIAIAPSRSEDGATRLLINSHQPFEGPVAWYEIRLHSEEGWNVAGGTFPGAPLVLHGHNEHLGWAHTVNHPDLVDVYALTTREDEYLLDGEWLPLERGRARIRVRLWGPFSWVFERPLFWSAHGPVVRAPHGDYAVRYAGMSEVAHVEQWYAMNRAQNWDDWLAAMEMQAIASLNTVYADADGRIAYLWNAAEPVRAPGWAWRDYLPGDRSDLIWTETHPLADLPLYLDPSEGWLASSNQTPFQASAEADALSPDAYPPEFGIEPRTTNRAQRAMAMLAADPAISRDDLLAIKWDHAYAPESAVGRLVQRIATIDLNGDPLLEEAQALVASWDLSADVDNTAAAISLLTARRAVANRHTDDPWLISPIEALRASAQDLMAHHGRLDVRWGDINRLIRGEVDLELNGGPDTLRAVYAAGAPLGPDGRRRAVAGDTYIMLVEWGADGALRSDAIHQYGSATTRPTSPHYADQAPLFAAEQLRRVPFTLEEVLAEATRDYRVGWLEPAAPDGPASAAEGD